MQAPAISGARARGGQALQHGGSVGGGTRRCHRWALSVRAEAAQAPLLVRAARGEAVERPPCWMMRQAGRYQKAYRDLAARHPSFRERSETAELIVEISLQPWRSFRPDGVILFSDILTPLPALGVPFEIDDAKGPIIGAPVRDAAAVAALRPLDLSQLHFVGDALRALKAEVGPSGAAVLGFIGCPWTMATYLVEGQSSATYRTIKGMCHAAPDVLAGLLGRLADELAAYAIYQADAGADAVMMFDSWGGQLPPAAWDVWSRPHVEAIVRRFKAAHPRVPLTLYANGSGGLLERLAATGADVVGLDWAVDMADARARLAPARVAVQGNVDPAVLFAPRPAIRAAVLDCVAKAGPRGHVLNLGHGVMVGTPEDAVAYMFDLSKELAYAS